MGLNASPSFSLVLTVAMSTTMKGEPLSTAVQTCTNTWSAEEATTGGKGSPPPPVFTPEELTNVLLNALNASRSVAGGRRYAEDAFKQITLTTAAHLNVFLHAYTHLNAQIPEGSLNDVQSVCGLSDATWAHELQSSALEVLYRELEAKARMSSRSHANDPSELTVLRSILPPVDPVPRVKVKACHFSFIGSGALDWLSSQVIAIKNSGKKPWDVRLLQVQTKVDHQLVSDAHCLFDLPDTVTVKPGERMERLLLATAVPKQFHTSYEQLAVLSVNNLVPVFITVTIVPLQERRLMPVGFPECVPLEVRDSVLGPHGVPFFLQVLKHQLVVQNGLSCPLLAHLLLGKSVNFGSHNRHVMDEVQALRRVLNEDFSASDSFNGFWEGTRKHKKCARVIPYTPPQTLSCPPPDLVEAKLLSSLDALTYPNPTTDVPQRLREATPAVIFGLILAFLSEMEVTLFDLSCISCDPASYLEFMVPHHRGVVMFVLDLCSLLNAHRKLNGVTPRGLALTFAAVLCRCPPPPSSAAVRVAIQQSAVDFLHFWIRQLEFKYEKK